MRCRWPIRMKVTLRRGLRSHLFDAQGIRIKGVAGNGPRLISVSVRLSVEMEAHKLHCPMLAPLPATLFT